MKAPLAWSVAAFGVSVVALGGAFFSGRGPGGGQAAAGVLEPGVAGRVVELEAQVLALKERVEAIEIRPASLVAPRTLASGASVSQEELEELRAALEEALAAKEMLKDTPLGDPEMFEEQVADSLTKIRKEEAMRSYRQHQDKQAEQLEVDVAKIEGWLGLSAPQSDSLRTALLTHYDRQAEVRRLWEEGAPDEILGEQKQADGEAFYADLGEFLDPEQLEMYWGATGGGSGK